MPWQFLLSVGFLPGDRALEFLPTRREGQLFVHYECDDETVKHVLKLDGYDGDEEECWVLLELTPAAAANAAAAEEADEA